MEGIFDPIYLLALLLFIVSFVYSSVGLGGGSSYTALMAIFGISYLAIPTVSLILNFFVSSISSFNFIRNKHARFDLIFPFLITSVPFAYLGGSLKLPKEVFYWILFISLIFVATKIYGWKSFAILKDFNNTQRRVVSLIAGAILGFVAGTVGIGGGVYLVPLILVLNLGTEKQAAACGAVFIFVNSVAGLAARLQYNPINLLDYVVLIIAVILGGTIGSYLGSTKLSPQVMQKFLGLIILLAIAFLFKKLVLT